MKWTNWILVLVLAGLAALAGCASGAEATRGPAPVIGAQETDVGTGEAVRADRDYRLGAGDQLRVTVFGEPELSGDFEVSGAGEVSMPLIGTIPVEGKSVREFQDDLERRLANGYLNNPRVSAEVTNYRPYYILGEVNQPGEYPYSNGLTVMNAVATAQGFTYRANKRVVFIRAAGSESERKVELTSSTPVRPGDTIRIGERIF